MSKEYIMPVIGLILIAINATGYILNLDIKHPALTVIGLVFCVVGGQRIQKNKNKKSN